MPYASQILSGKRPPQVAMAIRIFRATGHKLGPITVATEEEIASLEKHLAALDRFQGIA